MLHDFVVSWFHDFVGFVVQDTMVMGLSEVEERIVAWLSRYDHHLQF
jgi:hypothetical protein